MLKLSSGSDPQSKIDQKYGYFIDIAWKGCSIFPIDTSNVKMEAQITY